MDDAAHHDDENDLQRGHPVAPMQERVDMEKMSKTDKKHPRDTNNNDEERTHDLRGTADTDIPSMLVPGGIYLGEKDDPPQHEPTSQILHDGSNPTNITRLRNQREGHETPPGVGGVEMTCYPAPDTSRRHQCPWCVEST